MYRGDISNRVSPRVLIIFEGALGFISDRDGRKFDKALKRKQFDRAVTYWALNQDLVKRILWLFHRKDMSFEIVTFLGDGFASALLSWLDSNDIPVHRVWASTPEILGRAIEYMPDLACVYDPEPARWLMYGSKGRYLSDVNQLGDFYVN